MSYTYTINSTAFPNTVSGFNGVSGSVTIPNGGYVTGPTITTASSNWASIGTNFKSTNNKAIMTIPANEEKVVLEKHATLQVEGNVVINGLDLEERLKTIEKVLGIPERDATMEAKYPSLKKKFDEYINTLEKYRTFERIKGEE
jgi:hypothetical protein